uniref:Vesicular glutamate transporter 2 n=1 Tax=Scolopendra viridis TaxID=118503 RepID=A0A4D5R9M0_SCOVI
MAEREEPGAPPPPPPPPPPRFRLCPSCRMTITIMAFFACFLTYMLRLNLGIAIVSMVGRTNATRKKLLDPNNCSVYELERESVAKPGEFDWPKSEVGIVLSCFFYGYILTQIPSGWLCEKFGGKLVLIIGIGVFSATTLFIPEGARLSMYALIAIRIVQGMFSAVSFPSLHSIVGGWAPPEERGLLMSLAYSGMYVGTLTNFPLCSMLAAYAGWPYIFYVTGAFGIVWTIMAIFLIYSSPRTHPRISQKEKAFLEDVLDIPGTHDLKIPWLKILSSKAVWAITISHLAANWGLYTLALNLPLYMDNVLKFEIEKIGLLLSIPYISTMVVNILAGQISDIMHRKRVMSLTKQRKLFNTIGMVCPGILMTVLTAFSCHERYYAVVCITFTQALGGIAFAGGFFYNHVDIAPQFAGILMGMTNCLAQLPGILSPTIAGLITPNGIRSEWAIVFYLCTAMYALGAISYLIMGTAEKQPWAMDKPDHLVFDAPPERLRPLDSAAHRRPSLKPGAAAPAKRR